MTRLEKVAIYTYWKELAARLGMTDVPYTLEGFQQCELLLDQISSGTFIVQNLSNAFIVLHRAKRLSSSQYVSLPIEQSLC